MAKAPTVSTVTTGYFSTTQINANFSNIVDQFSNTLSLDGSTPNAMGADLDMDGNDLLNVGGLNMSGLPTSASGLSSGDVWNDGGTLKVV